MIEAGFLRHAALAYRMSFEFSVIPIIVRGKVPMIRWQDYQTSLPEESEVLEWWTRWPEANVGIVTGRISGITVVDVDTEAGLEALKKYMPALMLTPTAKTQKGGRHLYFKYVPGLSNRVRAIEGVDVTVVAIEDALGIAIAIAAKSANQCYRKMMCWCL